MREIDYVTYEKVKRMGITMALTAIFSLILAFIANGAGSLEWISLPVPIVGTIRLISLISGIGMGLSFPSWLLDRYDLRRGKEKLVWKVKDEKDKWDAKAEVEKYLESRSP